MSGAEQATAEVVGSLDVDGTEYAVRRGETVLEALERAGVDTPSGCRSGDCKKCLQRSPDPAPPGSQRGLRATLVEDGYFLACQARPAGRLRLNGVTSPRPVAARVVALEHHGPDVAQVFLRPDEPLAFRPGQFVDVLHPVGAHRSYSLAGLPGDGVLELHVRRVPEGLVSGWLHGLAEGAEVRVRGPFGQCFYTADEPTKKLLLVGAGTGLAPLLGIARDALARRHLGAIDLVHGALEPARFYLRDELERMAHEHPQLRVHHGVLRGATEREHEGDLGALAVRLGGALERVRAYLCGDDAIVRQLRRTLFLAGVPSAEIHSDPFTPAAAANPP